MIKGELVATMQRLLAEPVLVDLRNVYDRAEAERAGFTYRGLGRAA